MDVIWLLAAGAIMLLVGLSALVVDGFRRRSNPFPRLMRDLTTTLIRPGAALWGHSVQASGSLAPPTSGQWRPMRPRGLHALLGRITAPRIVPLVFFAGLVATCVAAGLYVATTMGTPQVAEGTAVIGYVQFQGEPREGSPTEAFSAQLRQVATASGLEPF
ncbi:MAG TPA: hypothetical protein VEY08_14995, partial [Chloroflexia bacterium]|nr:hypothetical protein [Chloroflexia bacterium]